METTPRKYFVNEIFYSLQGEGVRAGTPNVFIRFGRCNLACRIDAPMAFSCDTEFESGEEMTALQILQAATDLGGVCRNVIFTGGEPMLQVDQNLCTEFASWYKCIETNGLVAIEPGLDIQWICVSPKTAEHTLKQLHASEVKYVRRRHQAIPKPAVRAPYKIISPAFDDGIYLSKENLAWCIELVKANPEWRLSIQQHKIWGVR